MDSTSLRNITYSPCVIVDEKRTDHLRHKQQYQQCERLYNTQRPKLGLNTLRRKKHYQQC